MAKGGDRRRDDPAAGSGRSAEERERARLEREARRRAGSASPPPAQPDAATDRPPPARPPAPPARGARGLGRAAAGPRGERARPAADERGRSRPRRIEPRPSAPPPAAAGELDDDIERPLGIRRVRRSARPVVTPPGDRSLGPARRRAAPRVLALFALLVLATLVIAIMLLFQPFGSAEGDEVRVTIAQGSSSGDIGNQLAAAGVVDSGLLFNVRATLSGKRGALRSGPHALRENMSYGSAIEALSTAPVAAERPPTVNVTIPEGRARREIVPIVRRAGLRGGYLAASKRFAGALNPFRYGAPKGTRSTEGFLFPATYELEAGAPARDLVERQLATFRERFASVDLRRARRRNLTAYDVLIIASMVEREAQLASERPLIAAVIYNRLKDGMPLGIDATIRYALAKWDGALTQSDLAVDSPYNSRRRAGLPPTPIGNPGLASIRAAAAPANVGFRYFVVKPGTCGEHAFSSSDAQFQRDAQRYDAARAEAGNRAPTTCPD